MTEYLKEIIYGGVDGIVTTFAVVAGFSGAALEADNTLQLSFMTVLLFGLANLFADGTSMGLGNYLSVKSEQELFTILHEKEGALLAQDTTAERVLTQRILQEKGFTPPQAQTLMELYAQNPAYWTDWLLQHKHEMPDPRGVNPLLTGLATLVSFLVFGSVSLIPFFFDGLTSQQAWYGACAATVAAFVLLGVLKWRILGEQLLRSVLELLLIGGVSAVVAYMVGVWLG